MKYKNLHGLILNQPLLCTQEYLESVLIALEDKLVIDTQDLKSTEPEKEEKDPYIEYGVMTIPIYGSMVHRASWLQAASGVNSYQNLKSRIIEGLNNPEVTSIVLDVDSPGGSVSGAFELADYIFEAKEKKPIYAYANTSMASAAYLISAACTKVYATKTAQVGSIGVVALHVDKSQRIEQEGIKPTFIHAGKYKVSGNPYEKLNKDSKEYLQSKIDETYTMFIDSIVKYRGLDPEAVRDTEARVYSPETAKSLGLIDEVVTQENMFSIATGFENTSLKSETGKSVMEDEYNTLKEAVKALGFSVSADGSVTKIEEPEMITINGESVPKESIPDSVLAYIKEAEQKAEESSIEAYAQELMPNTEKSYSIKMAKLAKEDETLVPFLKSVDKFFADKMEEIGESGQEANYKTTQEMLDEMVAKVRLENDITKEQAFAKVASTPDGAKLVSKLYKGE